MRNVSLNMALNRFLVRVIIDRSEKLSSVELTLPNGTKHQIDLGEPSEDIFVNRFFNKQRLLYVILIKKAPPGDIAAQLIGTNLNIVLTVDGAPDLHTIPLQPTSMEQLKSLDRLVLKNLEQLSDLQEFCSALSTISVDAAVSSPVYMDFCYRRGNALFVNAWMPNFGLFPSFFLTAGASLIKKRSDILLEPRTDVSRHIEGIGLAANTDKHGFTAVLDVPRVDNDLPFWYSTRDS
jgi:hypothetical protein